MAEFLFKCPTCKQQLGAPAEMLGQETSCPSCGAVLQLPAPEPVVAPSANTNKAKQIRLVKGSLGKPASSISAESRYSVPSQPQTSGLAIASLILAVMCISLPAVICGHIARTNIRTSQGRLNGAGLAITGLVLGYIGIAFGVIVLSLFLFSSASSIQLGSAAAGDVARRETTLGTLATLSQAIQMYGLSHSGLPDSLDALTVSASEDIEALLDKNTLFDAWGQSIQYKKLSKWKYEIRSGGPDMQIGTDDDITN